MSGCELFTWSIIKNYYPIHLLLSKYFSDQARGRGGKDERVHEFQFHPTVFDRFNENKFCFFSDEGVNELQSLWL
jgi:hypothetical protein